MSSSHNTTEPIQVPSIIVEDWCGDGLPTSVLYMCGDNEISSMECYKSVSAFRSFPPCTHRNSGVWPCDPCYEEYNNQFWIAAAFLLDYFADFYSLDSEHMRCVWFEMIDTWQEFANYLSSRVIFEVPGLFSVPFKDTGNARRFSKHYKQARQLLIDTIQGRRNRSIPNEPFIHKPSGDLNATGGECNTGPYLSGLKPWQQFLCAGSPGSAHRTQTTPLRKDEDHNTSMSNTHDTTNHIPSSPPPRQIPQPAIAIMYTHLSRLRSRATVLDHLDLLDPLQNQIQIQDNPILPKDPRPNKPYIYFSPTTNRSLTYNFVNGAPPIQRYEGDADPSWEVEEPGFMLLDECIGSCRGVGGYEGIVAGGQQDGDGDDDDDDEDVDVGAFDLLIVEGVDGDPKRRGVFGVGMFDEWVGRDWEGY